MRLLYLLALWWATAACGACPGETDELLPPREQLAALERELAGRSAECGNHAGYLAYHGAVLNALGKPGEAALVLERSLLLDPQRPGAQIAYAEALTALGDSASGTAMLRDVLGRVDVPPRLRSGLERRLDVIDTVRRQDALAGLGGLRDWGGSGWQSGGSVALKLGRDTNLNSAPANSVLTLTLPEGNAQLLLADRFLPRGGNVGLFEASGQLARPLEGGRVLQLYGEARLRGSAAASDTNYQQLQTGGSFSQPLATGTALFSAGASQLAYGGDTLYRAFRMAAGRDWQVEKTCRPSVGLEAEWRRYPAATELDGRFTGLSVGGVCNFGADRLAIRLRGGQDVAQGDRAGGNQTQSDVRLVWARPLGNGRLGADLLWYHQQDAGGYSPLLENGATRRLDRVSAYLEYAYPLARAWSVVASIEGLNQRSNLALFDISGRAVYLGLRWTARP